MRQPKRSIIQPERGAMLSPPKPIPVSAMPMASPRLRTNQVETSVWAGIHAAQERPRAATA